MSGPQRIPRSAFHDWEADEGISLERWERRALRLIDAAWLNVQLDALEAASKKPTT